VHGRHFIGVWRSALAGWATPILVIYVGLVVLGTGYGLWKILKEYRKAAGGRFS